MRVGIVGCGLIGRKRASALAGCQLVVCCDVLRERAEAIAKDVSGASVSTNWREVVSLPDIQIVIVATTHDMLPQVACEAVRLGKHVLIEKPCARRSAELECVAMAARESGALVRTGFNHRYHPAIRKAREIFESGVIGELMYIRGRYGHGGRAGYEKEWRSQPEKSGGGELIDQGIHLIDLARWFLGDFVKVQGQVATYFWNIPVEDNGFMLLQTSKRQVAFLHASWTEWKNLFSFEVFGRTGKLEVSGLGGSYGMERLTFYQMPPQLGPPEVATWEYMTDDSWEVEFAAFIEDIRQNRAPEPGLRDAQAAFAVVEQLYRESGR